MKSYKKSKPYLSGLAVVWILLFLYSPAGGKPDEADVSAPVTDSDHPAEFEVSTESPPIWASGDEAGVYLILASMHKDKESFQIFYRQLLKDSFKPGPIYTGRPIQAIAQGERVILFLSGGGCQSYDMNFSYTEPRLPSGLGIVDGVTRDSTIYTLAVAEQAVRLSLPVLAQLSQSQDADTPDDGERTAAEPENRTENLSESPSPHEIGKKVNSGLDNSVPSEPMILNKGDMILLMHGRDNQWYRVGPGVVPVKDWQSNSIEIIELDHIIHLFGLKDTGIEHLELRENHYGIIQSLELRPVVDFTALAVNRQIRLVAAVSPGWIVPTENDSVAELDVEQVRYRIGRLGRDGWVFSEPLLKTPDEILTGPPRTICFATLGQNIAGFQWHTEEDVLFGLYSDSGALQEYLRQSVGAASLEAMQLMKWFMGGWTITILMAILIILVLSQRADVQGTAAPLPRAVQLAPLWRRIPAFLTDMLIVSLTVHLVIFFLFPSTRYAELLRTSMENSAQLTQFFEEIFYDPDKLKTMLIIGLIDQIVLVIYGAVCENLFLATIGKKLMSLVVVNNSGKRPSPAQIVVRNLLRFLDFYPNHQMYLITLIIVVITHRHQRGGDLLAKTMVVCKTPDLLNQLDQPEQSDQNDDSSLTDD
ncbi:MAG: RDD family protein [Sedimentisphaerales bacterium]|nr:RDD family protein [Sedimentisphaerales bacterium]